MAIVILMSVAIWVQAAVQYDCHRHRHHHRHHHAMSSWNWWHGGGQWVDWQWDSHVAAHDAWQAGRLSGWSEGAQMALDHVVWEQGEGGTVTLAEGVEGDTGGTMTTVEVPAASSSRPAPTPTPTPAPTPASTPTAAATSSTPADARRSRSRSRTRA